MATPFPDGQDATPVSEEDRQREDEFQEDDDDYPLVRDCAKAKEIVKECTIMITENVNLDSNLMAYLIQNDCILQEHMNQLKGPKRYDNNLTLTEIINQRGVSSFNGFVKALKQFTTANPGEGAHIDLLDRLKAKARRPSYRRTPTGSSFQKQDSQTSIRSDPHTSISTIPRCESIPEENQIAVNREQDVEKDMPQSSSQHKVNSKRSCKKTEPSTSGDEDTTDANTKLVQSGTPPKSTGEEGIDVPQFKYFVWCVAVVTCICSPVCFIGGVIILVLSVLAFGNAENCEGVGAKHSLSIFNFFFSLMSLSIPGLLIMFTIYFCCEHYYKDRWNQRRHKLSPKRLVVWLIIGFFLTFFILTVMELLYSLAYVASEVYTHYTDWRENETLCEEKVYLTSFTILTFSGAVVFILLTVLGVFVSLLFFRWVTDPDHPGTLQGLILAILPKNRTKCIEDTSAE